MKQGRTMRMFDKRPRDLLRSRGFSLVESMVALLVLSIGMLGIASLYLDSIRSGRTAIYRTQAVTLAADMAERIRANRTAGLAYGAGAADNNCADDDAGLAVPCTPIQMAAHDLFMEQQRVAAALPGGQINVVFVPPAGGVPATYSITVSWTEIGQANVVSYVMTVQI